MFFIVSTFAAHDPRIQGLANSYKNLNYLNQKKVIQAVQSFHGKLDFFQKKKPAYVFFKEFLKNFEAHAQSSNICLYGGFRSEMNDNVCTHPLNIPGPYREEYIKACESVFSANNNCTTGALAGSASECQSQGANICKTNTSFNVCNPILFGSKRSSAFFAKNNAGAKHNLSTYTSLSCYLDSTEDSIKSQNIDEIFESLGTNDEKLSEFLKILQDSIQLCLCKNNLSELSQSYTDRIQETNTCDALLLQLLNLLQNYDKECSQIDQTTELAQFLNDLQLNVLEQYENDLMTHMQGAKNPKKFREYLEEYKQYVGFDNDKSKDQERKDTIQVVDTLMEGLKDKFCIPLTTILADDSKKHDGGDLPEVTITAPRLNPESDTTSKSTESACFTFEVEQVIKEEKYILKPVLTINKDCEEDKEDNYTIVYIDDIDSEEEIETDPLRSSGDAPSSSTTSTTTLKSTTSTTAPADDQEGSNKVTKDENPIDNNDSKEFKRKDDSYTVKFNVYKKDTQKIVTYEDVEISAFGDKTPCDKNSIKLVVKNSCNDGLPGIFCIVSVSFDINCEGADLEEIKSSQYTINWSHPDVGVGKNEGDEKKGTLSVDTEKNFIRAIKDYPVKFEATVKFKFKEPETKDEDYKTDYSQNHETDLTGSTNIPYRNTGPGRQRQNSLSEGKQ